NGTLIRAIGSGDSYTVTMSPLAGYTFTTDAGCSGTLSANTTCNIAFTAVVATPATSTLSIVTSGLNPSDNAGIAVTDSTNSAHNFSTSNGNGTLNVVLGTGDSYSVGITPPA